MIKAKIEHGNHSLYSREFSAEERKWFACGRKFLVVVYLVKGIHVIVAQCSCRVKGVSYLSVLCIWTDHMCFAPRREQRHLSRGQKKLHDFSLSLFGPVTEDCWTGITAPVFASELAQLSANHGNNDVERVSFHTVTNTYSIAASPVQQAAST